MHRPLLAKVTGFAGDSFIDVITGSGIGRYLRLFALVPVWALVAAGLATPFIEGGRWMAAAPARRDRSPGGPARPAGDEVPPRVPAPRRRPRRRSATRRGEGPPPAAEATRARARAAPEPEPEPEPEPQPAARATRSRRRRAQPAPRPTCGTRPRSETRSPAGAAGARRPRRIPRPRRQLVVTAARARAPEEGTDLRGAATGR